MIDGKRELFATLREVREHIELKCISDRRKFHGVAVWRNLDNNGSTVSWKIHVDTSGRVHFRKRIEIRVVNGQLVASW